MNIGQNAQDAVFVEGGHRVYPVAWLRQVIAQRHFTNLAELHLNPTGVIYHSTPL